ncbi:BON domain-containing protein [Pandoraea sp.]|uniref:BON domain-containing protein n=1 Tax=Pandoraea sp. TaxID=1883445 RepID=UPI001214C2EB|nr:BON domain-containing protein [Pandoraea sp.]TAL55802.1 MAG: BON domain-containing protein [Pandoraea sp.]TAM15686.1 MAG: BON domain-containing protein [Pandoraea sp.]
MKTDAQLQQDVMEELAWEPSVNATEIGVEVKNGIVTLAGHVASFVEKHAAERAAQRVSGVKAVIVEITVKLPVDSRRSDTDIAAAALSALAWHTSLPAGMIGLKVENGWLTLTGEVDWPYQKFVAAQALKSLRGVTGVTNLIAVKPRVVPDDVKHKIDAALQRQAQREAGRIDVAISGGTVTLSGKVHSVAERHAAERAAWSAPGVTAVFDHLTLE